MKTIYDFTAFTNHGVEKSLADFRGKVLLIVNTASKCGFTPQYKELEALYQKYRDAGLVVIGFPCDQFAHQEPGTDAEVEQFCQINFGVTFPLMKKIDVNGENEHPLYSYLKNQAGGCFGKRIKWNFTKFLVSRDGCVIKRYAPITKPMKLENDIIDMLKFTTRGE